MFRESGKGEKRKGRERGKEGRKMLGGAAPVGGGAGG